jgi:hypothetical protein
MNTTKQPKYILTAEHVHLYAGNSKPALLRAMRAARKDPATRNLTRALTVDSKRVDPVEWMYNAE